MPANTGAEQPGRSSETCMLSWQPSLWSTKPALLGEINYFIAPPVQHGLDHIQTKSQELIHLQRRWHRQLLSIDDHVDQRRPGMLECLPNRRPDLCGCLGFEPEDIGGSGDLRKI